MAMMAMIQVYNIGSRERVKLNWLPLLTHALALKPPPIEVVFFVT